MTIDRQVCYWLCVAALVPVLAGAVRAQVNTGFQYFYDDLGQLTKVVDSTGTVIEYVYDPVGNILQIKRSSVAPGTLAIFNFTPQSGGPTQTVTIQGQAFDPTPANDTVQFNGTTAPAITASTTSLTVAVPLAATTGPISVTVAGQTVTSTINFTVLPAPVITSLSRKSALLGTSFPNAQFPGLTVTGANLGGSTFSLAPATNPPAATFGAPTIDPTGASATMSLSVGTSVTGTFALVATNASGSSSALATKANRFTIVDPRSTADTDGNGVSDVLKAFFGIDVLDPAAFPPALPSMFGQAESPAFTVLNASAGATQATLTAESPAFAVLNGNSQRGTQTFEAESPAFTTLNSSVSSSKATFTAESPAFTVENASSSRGGTQAFNTESPLFSLLNGGTSVQKEFMAESSLFSLLNNQGANLLLPESLIAKNFHPSPRPRSQSEQRALHKKKARKAKATKPAKAGGTQPGSSSVRDRQFTIATSQTETKTTDQEGAVNANQNK